MDHSRGYENVAESWMAKRGNLQQRAGAIGVEQVRAWARTLRQGCTVLDAGCGPGVPLTTVLVEEGLQVYGVDASSTFADAFRQNLPDVPVACASVLDFDFFGRSFDAVLSVGLIFLLPADDQARLLRKFVDVLNRNGRLLFTAPERPCEWVDVMTGLESASLGAEEYRRQLKCAGATVDGEYEDAGGNHYFDVRKLALHL